MRLDVNGVVKFLDKTTGDGIEISLGTTCCSDFATSFSKLLNSLFDGKVAFIDVDSDGDGSIDTYSGFKAVFIDTAGNTITETVLDGVNGKVDLIDTGYSKIIRVLGSVNGSGTSEVYVAKVIFTAIGINTSDMKTPVEFELGENTAPSTNVLAEIDSATGQKGIKVLPDNTTFGFELSLVLM